MYGPHAQTPLSALPGCNLKTNGGYIFVDVIPANNKRDVSGLMPFNSTITVVGGVSNIKAGSVEVLNKDGVFRIEEGMEKDYFDPDTTSIDTGNDGLGTGAVAAISITVFVVVVAIIGFIVYFLCIRDKYGFVKFDKENPNP